MAHTNKSNKILILNRADASGIEKVIQYIFGQTCLLPLILFIILCAMLFLFNSCNNSQQVTATEAGSDATIDTTTAEDATPPTHPLMIKEMRKQEYPGSELTFEQTLTDGYNYHRYIVSYLSEGNKIYALLTIPHGKKPATGWPVIIFNHGYIPPEQYRTTERYVYYVAGFANKGYMVFLSDYRGHGSSEGEATGSYSSPNYTIDILNGMASVKRHPDADPNRIGMWGHSMGGHITLRAMVVSKEIKAGVIWAGVLGAYPDLFVRGSMDRYYPGSLSYDATTANSRDRRRGRWRTEMIQTYGGLQENPGFWAAISANSYLKEISGPLQLHHGTADSSVPITSSQALQAQMEELELESQLYIYQGDNHNLSKYFNTAMAHSVAFFDKYVKGE
jgi:dienelactone hydrolase